MELEYFLERAEHITVIRGSVRWSGDVQGTISPRHISIGLLSNLKSLTGWRHEILWIDGEILDSFELGDRMEFRKLTEEEKQHIRIWHEKQEALSAERSRLMKGIFPR